MNKSVDIKMFDNGVSVTFNETVDCKDRCDYLEYGTVASFDTIEDAWKEIKAFVLSKTCLMRLEAGEVRLVPTV